MVLQLDKECGVEISWDDNESIENIHLCFHGSENEETILRFVKQLCSYWDCRAIDVQTSEFLNIIPEKEYSFSNTLFWNVILHHHIQAFDEEKDTNLDEVWDEELAPASLDRKAYMEYWSRLTQIDLETLDNQGEIENPNILILPVGKEITLTIEYHPCCTYYFLNDMLIGEVSGNFHLKYLTYPELMRIAKQKHGDVLFHLLLPLSVIREQEKDIAFNEIAQRLQQIPLFQEHSKYIGKCILNGLLVPNSNIQEIPEIGTICISNHSYRNALVYDDEKQEIKELNILLSKL